MFRTTNSPIHRSTFWLYIQLVVQWTGRQQCRCIVPKAVYTVKKGSWGWANLSSEICRAELKRLINEKVVASCWLFTSLSWSFLYAILSMLLFPSSVLGTSIVSCTLHSNTLNLYHSLNVTNQVVHSMKPHFPTIFKFYVFVHKFTKNPKQGRTENFHNWSCISINTQ